jgi:NADPH:quinone reductase-like Zn-dependent oxidoreductase
MLAAKTLATATQPHALAGIEAKTMKAITRSAYGSADVLELETIDIPLAGDDEVRVRVHAASVCKGDIHLLTGTPYLVRLMGIGLFRAKHRVQGQSMAGRVEAVGKNVTSFQLGDAVYGQVPFGAFAEYVCIPASELTPKPANLSFEEAAAIPDSGLTVLQGLRDVGQLQRGQNVLINGASGGVGTFAVQIAKALGAEVTAVCSTRHIDAVRMGTG